MFFPKYYAFQDPLWDKLVEEISLGKCNLEVWLAFCQIGILFDSFPHSTTLNWRKKNKFIGNLKEISMIKKKMGDNEDLLKNELWVS